MPRSKSALVVLLTTAARCTTAPVSFETSARTWAGSEMSPATFFTRGSRIAPSPTSKQTMRETGSSRAPCPSASRSVPFASTRAISCCPRNPAPPVTRISMTSLPVCRVMGARARPRRAQRTAASALSKKSSAPKLPDLRASATGTSVPASAGTPGSISGPIASSRTPSACTTAPEVSPPAMT